MGKEPQLRELLEGMGSVVVALSGGVDSAYLAWVAHQTLGARALAVTGESPSFPEVQREAVRRFIETTRMHHQSIETREMEVDGYVANAPNRCFHCKAELYTRLTELAQERGYGCVLDGTNADDLTDHRPGRVAAAERGVRSPFVELAIGKTEIREGAREAGLEVWDAPASACLSSRIPHGTPVTIARLTQVERGETALRALGFRQFRLRNHDTVARVEIATGEMEKALDPEMRQRIVAALKPLGFRFVAVDLEGYRTGSFNA